MTEDHAISVWLERTTAEEQASQQEAEEGVTRAGTILYLNGTSSAGKSSLANAIQELLEEPFLHLGIDTLFGAMSRRYNRYGRLEELQPPAEKGTRWILDADGRILEISFGEHSRRMIRGFHAMVAALAREGNNVVVDDVLFEPPMALHCAVTLAGLPAYLIGVRCRPEVAERRERERGNRLPGLTRLLFDAPHHFGIYDLEVDTSDITPAEGAERIQAHLASERKPTAFERLAALAENGRDARGA